MEGLTVPYPPAGPPNIPLQVPGGGGGGAGVLPAQHMVPGNARVLNFLFFFFWLLFFIFYFHFLGPHLQHMEVPRATGGIEAAAAGLHHSNAGSEPHLQRTLQLVATPDP